MQRNSLLATYFTVQFQVDDRVHGVKKITKELFTKPGKKKNLSKGTKHTKLCLIDPSSMSTDLNVEVVRAIEEAREKAGRCSNHLEYITFKDLESENIIARRKREYEYRLKDATTHDKYGKILKRKSEQQYFKNLKKKCTSLNHKSQDLHKMHKLQQDSAYQLLREERAMYLKKLYLLALR